MARLKVLSVVALASVAASSGSSIPLRPGDYGAIGLACGSEPNAAIMSFDGYDFMYPHATQGVDVVMARSAGVFTIAETCHALGDAKPDIMTFKLRPRGSDRVDLTKPTNTLSFRRCGDATFFEKH